MFENPFVLKTEEYKRDINILQHYVNDQAAYLELMTGKPYDQCLDFVKQSVRAGGQFEFKDPAIIYLERGENGDREKKEGTLSVYLKEAIVNRELIAPTFTIYTNPKKKQSLLVDFIDGNVKARSAAKKTMFKARVAGDKSLATIKNIEQDNKKRSNNSISGAHVSASTPLYNKTAHSTLTSNCRSTSAFGNANNEKFLCGNRHYWSPEITRNNIVSIINHTDYDQLAVALKQFGIRHPTVEETIACVRYSTDLYWTSNSDRQRIDAMIYRLTDIQRSAFVYTGDMYHLMKFNDAVVRGFVTKISSRIEEQHPDPKSILSSAPDDQRYLANQICANEMKGKSLSDIEGTPAYGILASTLQNIQDTMQEYRLMIRALWTTTNVPASLAVFPDSIRRSAITSDTDSTIFTVQDWVLWHEGVIGFDDRAMAIGATMIFLASQSIIHVLARMSANFGIVPERLYQIAMKNEYYFAVFVPTQVAKHYYGVMTCQEGNVFKEVDKEIKGVHLKSSNVAKVVMKDAQKMMEFIMAQVMEGKKIEIKYLLKWIADLERKVMESIKRGGYEYFRRNQIRSPDSYKEGEASPNYGQYLMWNEVFGPKYGEVIKPPYITIKVSSMMDTRAKAVEWLASIKDRELAARMEAWMAKNNRTCVTTFMLPEQIISSTGIPEEILAIVGVRRIVLDTTRVFYLILETLGMYMLNNKNTRLVSDNY